MIVRHFLQWVQTAPAARRADATGALARAYLYSDLSPDERAAAEEAMIFLLDDPSANVRYALAEPLARSPDAPDVIILALADDLPEIAAIVLERSPLLFDADLVDFVGAGESWKQAAIARRMDLPRSVSAAIAEVGSAEACLSLAENPTAEIPAFSIERIVERHGHLSAIRESLFGRSDLPASMRQMLVVKLSDTLAGQVIARDWMNEAQVRRIAREACDKVTVALAARSTDLEIRPLVRHLRESGQLTAGLVLRALLSGNLLMFEEALSELSSLPLSRVTALIHDRRAAGLRAVYDKAGLPASAFPAVRVAIEAMHEIGFIGERGGEIRLRRRVIERVLTHCEQDPELEVSPLLALLRRFATESAREEARLFCDELAAA
ncbi:MAG TPA: DUF2336 domain-containing protein [Xanthobacteraceae bacterium]|jgi:uncharacterized protein (DUF2336 family)|nr:DUF2336 domain-containing protein [Xanthobacteraceae bacterium]